jgi:hypothetical protein
MSDGMGCTESSIGTPLLVVCMCYFNTINRSTKNDNDVHIDLAKIKAGTVAWALVFLVTYSLACVT